MKLLRSTLHGISALALRILHIRIVPTFLAITLIWGFQGAAQADSFRTQSIQLNVGWNAVFLEVEPDETDPKLLFQGTPIQSVARWDGGSDTRQFVSNPAVDLSRASGWLRWYRSEKEYSFLSDLGEIYGGEAYLIRSSETFVWRVDGRPVTTPVKWASDSYNFVGFSVSERGGPTFYEFFEGSQAHRDQPIYRLKDNVWKKVANPAAESIRPNEAFWIRSKGSSNFQGPLNVAVPGYDGLLLRDSPIDLVLTNSTSFPLSYSVSHVVEGGKPGVPLSIEVRVLGDRASPLRTAPVDFPAFAWRQELPEMDGGFSTRMPVALRRSDLGSEWAESYLMFESSLATRVWVPIKVLPSTN